MISKNCLYRIITQLENLKKEAAEVAKKMEETDTVMAEVDRVSQEYMPLSTACSSIYFTLEGLNQVKIRQEKLYCDCMFPADTLPLSIFPAILP